MIKIVSVSGVLTVNTIIFYEMITKIGGALKSGDFSFN